MTIILRSFSLFVIGLAGPINPALRHSKWTQKFRLIAMELSAGFRDRIQMTFGNSSYNPSENFDPQVPRNLRNRPVGTVISIYCELNSLPKLTYWLWFVTHVTSWFRYSDFHLKNALIFLTKFERNSSLSRLGKCIDLFLTVQWTQDKLNIFFFSGAYLWLYVFVPTVNQIAWVRSTWNMHI